MSIKLEINTNLRALNVRVIDEQGNQMGVMSLRDALSYARSCELDLVKIAEANPPVCRVVDAGKFLFDQQKQQRLAAKRQRAAQVELKEVQLRPTIDTNDLMVKAKRAKGFLEEGDQVKVVMRFRGRENTHKDIGRAVIEAFKAEIGPHKVIKPLTENGNQYLLIFGPEVQKAAA